MSHTASPVNGSSGQSSQSVESPEVAEARAKAAQAGYERNRAEAAYNQAKKDHGADSAQAKSAKEALEKAQADVEKAQGELRDALKLNSPKSASKPQAPQTEPPNAPKEEAPKAEASKSPAKSAPEAPKVTQEKPTEKPRGAILEHRVLKLYRSEEFIRINPVFKDGELKKRLEKLLKENPKALEHLLNQPHGEMSIDTSRLPSAPKLEKR